MKKISLGHFFRNRNLRISDPLLLFTVLALAIYGTVMIGSAGTAYAQFRYNDAFYFLKRQILFLVVGIPFMLFVSALKTDWLYKATIPLCCVTWSLLLLVLLVGFTGNGARRWISIGPITIQPSEIAKLCLVLLLAKYYSDRSEKALSKKNNCDIFLWGTFIPLGLLLTFVLPIMLQKHLSCIIILGMIGFLVIFASGANPKYLFGCMGVGIIGVACLALFTDYTKERITVWLNPEAYRLEGGWQTLQGLMAIGSGGLFGRGFGRGVLKHCYISEPANDMIFTVLCEELGFVGAAIALLLFAVLIFRGMRIAVKAPTLYLRLTAFGITAQIAVQTLLNLAVVTNSIPNTGISLPFFSYGGSSLLMLFFEIGVLLSVEKESKTAVPFS